MLHRLVQPLQGILRSESHLKEGSAQPEGMRGSSSAIANAEHNDGADIDVLKVTRIHVEQGPVLKRFTARAKGRGNRISKQTCHIYVTVGD